MSQYAAGAAGTGHGTPLKYNAAMIRVLFVCMGNICRSPMAEAVFRHLVEQAGLQDQFEIDSAGTGPWHVGSGPHPETLEQLTLHGIDGSSQRARQVQADDLSRFDYVVAMDATNLADLRQLQAQSSAEVVRLLDFAHETDAADVPDPYYAGGYDHVYELVNTGCHGLLNHILEHDLTTGRAHR